LRRRWHGGGQRYWQRRAATDDALGLGTAALIGDQIQALQQRQVDLEKQLQSSQAELENQRKELERLKKQAEEY